MLASTVMAMLLWGLVPGAAVAASISATPDPGVTGEPINFGITDPELLVNSYDWNYGDGTTQTVLAVGGVPILPVTHPYAAAGGYLVTAVPSTPLGPGAPITKVIVVNAPPPPPPPPPPPNQAPVASFAPPSAPTAGEPVVFDATSSTDDSGSYTCKWDFPGNQPVPNQCIVVARFASGGQATVKLTVTDAGNLSDSLTRTFTVKSAPGQPTPPAGTVVSGAVVSSPLLAPGNAAPSAGFTVSPKKPYVGESVEFTSFSSDSNGRLRSQTWDLDGDGGFDDATGAVVSRKFKKKGRKTVRLRVADAQGAADVETRTVDVRTRAAGVLFPFPVVRLVGRFSDRTTVINRFAVAAPKGTSIKVSCKGRSCPVKGLRAKGRGTRKSVVFKRLQRRLRVGVRMSVTVASRKAIGKVTVFQIRKNKPPLRSDRCLRPGATKSSRCPSK